MSTLIIFPTTGMQNGIFLSKKVCSWAKSGVYEVSGVIVLVAITTITTNGVKYVYPKIAETILLVTL